MKRFKNILVVAGGKDGGVAAVTRAADLAKRNDAKVTIVDTLAPFPPLLEIPGIAEEELHEELVERKLAELHSLVERCGDENVPAECRLLQGPPAELIIRSVITGNHDLLIKTADQPSGIYQRLFGTTGHRLMRKCPCPVWIVKAGTEHRFHRILAAVDPKPNDKRHNALNVKTLELATSIADLDDSELHVICVWPPWTNWTSPRSQGDDSTEFDRYQRETSMLQERMLSVIIKPFQQQDQIDHVHLLKGKPSDQIALIAAEMKIELLVMGTVCRTGVSGFLIGNTAESVLDQVNCSVLTLKPKGFVTPVVVSKHQDDVI